MSKLLDVAIGDQDISELTITMRGDPELYRSQMALELGMKEAGIQRYHKKLNKAVAADREDETSYGDRIIGTQVDTLADALRELVESRHNLPAGSGCVATPLLAAFGDYYKLAFLTMKGVIGTLTKGAAITSICVRVGQYVEDEIRIQRLKEHDKDTYKRMLKAVRKKCDYRKKRETEIYVGRVNNLDWNTWTEKDRFKVGLLLVDTFQKHLPEMVEEKVTTADIQVKGKYKTTKHLVATPAMREWIENHIDLVEAMNPIYEPMVVPPVPWSPGNVLGGGYISSHVPQLKLVKVRQVKALEEIKRAEMPEFYEAINAAQDTAWRIRKPVLELLQHLYRQQLSLGKFPVKGEQPAPVKPPEDECHNDNPAFLRWKTETKSWHEAELNRKNVNMSVYSTLKTAEKYQVFDQVYMPWQADFRGRIYPVPALNCQGEDYVKALLEFSEGKPLGDGRAVYWLKVHTANLFGVDKVSFDERCEWVDAHWDELLDCADDPYAHRLWEEADKPFQAYAACLELRGYAINGLDHVCRMPVALDGSCSGLQNLGMAFGCEITGKSVNLIPADKPQDIYREVAEKVIRMMTDACNGAQTIEERDAAVLQKVRQYYFKEVGGATENKFPKFLNKCLAPKKNRNKDDHGDAARKIVSQVRESYAWLKFGITRTTCKRAVMTFPYGSKEFGMKEQVMEDTLRPARKVTEDKDWPFCDDGYSAAAVFARFIYRAVKQTVLKAADAMDWMQDTARLVAGQNRPVKWQTPLGFPVTQDYRKTKQGDIQTVLNGTRRRYRYRIELADIDTMKQANSISPNVVHSLDSTHLLMTVAAAKREGMPGFALVHDSFGVTPADTERFFAIIREQFYKLYAGRDVFGELAAGFRSQIAPDLRDEMPPLPGKGRLDLAAIHKSLYAFA